MGRNGGQWQGWAERKLETPVSQGTSRGLHPGLLDTAGTPPCPGVQHCRVTRNKVHPLGVRKPAPEHPAQAGRRLQTPPPARLLPQWEHEVPSAAAQVRTELGLCNQLTQLHSKPELAPPGDPTHTGPASQSPPHPLSAHRVPSTAAPPRAPLTPALLV